MTEDRGRPFFILNPVAGGGRAKRAEPIIRGALRPCGITDPRIALTEAPGHATILAREAGDMGFSPVVGVGGDGTMNEIANGLLRASRRAPMGVVPAGTGNDFVRSLGLPRDVEVATRLACSGAPVADIDVGRCGDHYFLNVGGLGFDAQVAQAVHHSPRMLRFGPLPFVVCTLRELARNTIHPLNIYLDDELIQQRTLMIAVANGAYYGGGMMIAPHASRGDGLLDVCVVGELSRMEVLQLLPKVFSGGHVGHPKVTFYRARTVRVEGTPTTLVEIDGDVIGSVPVEFTVASAALQVIGAKASIDEDAARGA